MNQTVRVMRSSMNENPYYIANRKTAQDKTISYEALGFLHCLLSHHARQVVQPEQLVREDCNLEKVYLLLAELVSVGYLLHIESRDNLGHIRLVEYTVYETATPEDNADEDDAS